MSERIVVVGPGRMGLALGTALRMTGEVEALAFMGRALEPPPHPVFDDVRATPGAVYMPGPAPIPQGTTLVLLAVADSALAEVAYDLARAGPAPSGCVALHLSGAVSASVLEPLHAAGYSTGTMHPLQSVADPWRSGDRMFGIAFAISGEPAALRAARRVAGLLDGLPLVIAPAQRPLYHAAAATAASGIVVLMAMAAGWLAEAGLSEEESRAALVPLMQGTLENLRHLGVESALTGPIARGDVDTVRLHLSRLSGGDRSLYCALGREALKIARSSGLDPQRAEAIEALLGSH